MPAIQAIFRERRRTPGNVKHQKKSGWVVPFVWLAIGLLVAAPGCVRRRLLVRSNPSGAMVYVDNQPIGLTPCATSFVYYGTREIRLVKGGYETLTVNQPIPAPWYQLPPIDFVSENLVPKEIQDYRTVTFNLAPQVVMPSEQLLARADELRHGTHAGANQAIWGAPLTGSSSTPSLGEAIPGESFAPTTDPYALPVYPIEPIRPGALVPPSGNGQLPLGGVPLEALPAP